MKHLNKKIDYLLSNNWGKNLWQAVLKGRDNRLYLCSEVGGHFQDKKGKDVSYIAVTEKEFIALIDSAITVMKRDAARKEKLKHIKLDL